MQVVANGVECGGQQEGGLGGYAVEGPEGAARPPQGEEEDEDEGRRRIFE